MLRTPPTCLPSPLLSRALVSFRVLEADQLDPSSPDLCLPVFFWPLMSQLTLSRPQRPSLPTHQTKVVPPSTFSRLFYVYPSTYGYRNSLTSVYMFMVHLLYQKVKLAEGGGFICLIPWSPRHRL